jgi:ParB-like chromosome segregation protein Spo0J
MATTVDATEIMSFTGLKPMELELDQLSPNPWQTRRKLDRNALIELAEDIRLNGLIQPIVARRNLSNTAYEIAAGHRRFEAFKLLRDGYEITGPAEEDSEGNLVPGEGDPDQAAVSISLTRKPDPRFAKILVIVRVLGDQDMMRIVLSENSKRRDIEPMEEAFAFKKMIADLGISQSEFARRMGLGQSTVANRLRMFQLPESVQELIGNGKLSQWQGMSLLGWKSKHNLSDWYVGKIGQALSDGRVKMAALEEATWHFSGIAGHAIGGLEMNTTEIFDVKKECIESGCEFFLASSGGYGAKICGKPGHYHSLRQEAAEAERRRRKEAELADQKLIEESNARFKEKMEAYRTSPQNVKTPEEVADRQAQFEKARAAQLAQIEAEKQTGPIINRVEKLDEPGTIGLLILQIIEAETNRIGRASMHWHEVFPAFQRYFKKHRNMQFQDEAAVVHQLDKLKGQGWLFFSSESCGLYDKGRDVIKAARVKPLERIPPEPEIERDEGGIRLISYQDTHRMAGSIRSFQTNQGQYNYFSRNECIDCEHYARLKTPDGKATMHFYCLNPDHFDQLVREQDIKLREQKRAEEEKARAEWARKLQGFNTHADVNLTSTNAIALDKHTARLLARLVMAQVQREQPQKISAVRNWLKSQGLSDQLRTGMHHQYTEAAGDWIDKEIERFEKEGRVNYLPIVLTAVRCVIEAHLSTINPTTAWHDLPTWVNDYVKNFWPEETEVETASD